ncbi:MAG: ATP-binding protein [Defluviitaleaceae bacterium]|nr:ATP-binding protein [Defluviitaleaceae bacterium]
MVKTNAISIEPKIENENVLLDFISSELSSLGYSEHWEFLVAAEEVFSNTVFYANIPIHNFINCLISYDAEKKQASLKFEDYGKPFNPLTRPVPELNLSIKERKIGGLGIHIVKDLMDDVEYEYDNVRQMNMLTLLKKL